MKLQDYKNSDKYRIENTYVMYQKGTNTLDKWVNDGLVCFYGSQEDAWCGINPSDFPNRKPITAEELFYIDKELFAEYVKAIDIAFQNGELN